MNFIHLAWRSPPRPWKTSWLFKKIQKVNAHIHAARFFAASFVLSLSLALRCVATKPLHRIRTRTHFGLYCLASRQPAAMACMHPLSQLSRAPFSSSLQLSVAMRHRPSPLSIHPPRQHTHSISKPPYTHTLQASGQVRQR